jgi:hypothetical protein
MSFFLGRSSKGILVFVSIGFLISSFTQKCYCTTNLCADSLFVFLFGPFGFFMSWAGLTWLANPLLITSWVVVKRNPRLSLITSLLASILALSFLLFTKVIDDEGGDLSQIISYKQGYWLWVLSSLIMFIGNVIYFFKNDISNKSPDVRSL